MSRLELHFCRHDLAAIGQAEGQIADGDARCCFCREYDAWRLVTDAAGFFDCVIKGHKTLDDREIIGQRDIGIDEEAQRAFDPTEGTGGLCENTKLYLADEVEGRCHNIGNDRADLAITGGEHHQLFAACDNGEEIPDHIAEAVHQEAAFLLFATQQGHLLGVFPETREREAEIGLVALLLEIETDQTTTNHMRDEGAKAGIEHGNPEEEARDRDFGARNGEIGGNAP